ncbi:hypothetical protein [Xanthomonas translucens]|uniref:Transmembrane protein n=3 Tax=Xanthomonas campestris pv. translucens TaxID=343 RepID=A0A109HNQ2_XANCT|nr:hypothetical protein [Xanthomonas translucens]KTF41524.1 hypothetical protein OZ12_01255 [Xanthomonas translucens pv. translucens]KWV10131.1 hypothetical protein ATB54_19715 [Xanthomonas translucens]KWV15672.1 hypothetical protein ATB53_11315 [Xanthomonas translucens]MCC8446973.1 hypothetical protein [Xanthomonas translucens pv. translucens]MCS3358440.1 hypothetical protein [Xanthomonas translucens pv. translucens]
MPPPPLPTARNPMIDTMAKISLLVGVAWLLYALVQLAVLALLPNGTLQAVVLRIGIPLPALLQWCLDHRLALSLLSALLALLFSAAAWGLLRRHEWARLGFVAFLVVTALANFASLPLLWQFFGAMQQMLPEAMRHRADGAQLLGQLQTGRVVSIATAAATALVFAALHGWLVYQLYRPAIRAEFRS